MADITIVNGVYKPTYNWRAPCCVYVYIYMFDLYHYTIIGDIFYHYFSGIWILIDGYNSTEPTNYYYISQ
jgi:hypothetical protein